MTRITGYDHVSLTVSDAERSAAWYVEILGFVVVRQVQNERFERVILVHSDSKVALGLTHHRLVEDETTFSEHRLGMDHVAFTTDSHQELKAWKRRFEQLGVAHSEIKENAAGALITLRDPDNIQLEIRATADAS